MYWCDVVTILKKSFQFEILQNCLKTIIPTHIHSKQNITVLHYLSLCRVAQFILQKFSHFVTLDI